MLKLTIPAREFFDEDREIFVNVPETKITLEHSLVSLAKWESKWHKPFLDKKQEKTKEETVDYIRCMTLTKNVDPNAYYGLTADNIDTVREYIKNPMTATTFGKSYDNEHSHRRAKVPTAETIYYRMICHQVPVEFQKWHLNRLLTLLKVCDEEAKAQNPNRKKTPKKELYNRNRELNERRRAALHSKG